MAEEVRSRLLPASASPMRARARADFPQRMLVDGLVDTGRFLRRGDQKRGWPGKRNASGSVRRASAARQSRDAPDEPLARLCRARGASPEEIAPPQHLQLARPDARVEEDGQNRICRVHRSSPPIARSTWSLSNVR